MFLHIVQSKEPGYKKGFNKISLWMIAIVATSENWKKKNTAGRDCV
jgi:hypothetical protein